MQLPFARQLGGDAAYAEHSGERLLNCYARPFPDGGVGPFIIAMSPGLTPVVTLAAGQPVRAVYAQRGAIYAACGGRLWSVSNGVATDLGAIKDGATTISGNGLQVVAVVGGKYYVWDGTSLTQPFTGAFSTVGNVAALDGYMLMAEAGGQRWSISDLAAAAKVDALDFASAESAPDFLVRVHVDHSEVWLFGTRSTEIWANTGAADFPFSRISGGKLDRGCLWAGSVASEDNSVFWVGDDRVVYRANGYQPQRVSTQTVESILKAQPEGANVTAFTFTQEGAKVYALILPDRPALLYDIASGLWHERNTGLGEGRWLAYSSCRCGGDQFVGTTDGRLCRMAGLTDAGAVIMREGVSLPLSPDREDFSVDEVVLHFQTGGSDIGRPAQVMLQCSKNGREWSRERWRSLGSVGQYDRWVRWPRWGQASQFRWRFRITDPIDTALYGATIKAAR